MHTSRPGLLVLAILLIAGLAFIFWPEGQRGGTGPGGAGAQAAPPGTGQKEKASGGEVRAAETPAGKTAEEGTREVVPGAPTYAITGQVLTIGTTPVAGGTIEAFATSANARPFSMSSVLTMAGSSGPQTNPFAEELGDPLAAVEIRGDSTFAIPALPTPHVKLRLTHPFYALTGPEIVHVGATRRADVVLRPYLGGHIVGRIQDFEPGAQTPGPVRLTAEMDPHYMMKNPKGFMSYMATAMSRKAVLDPETGKFEFRAVLPSKSVQLSYRDDRQATRSPTLRLAEGQRREVVMRAEPSGAVQITVTGKGAPLERARIALALVSGQSGARVPSSSMARRINQLRKATDAAGQCLIGGVQAGVYEVTVEDADWLPTTTEVEVHAGKTATATVDLSQGGAVRGIVYDPHGEPLRDARVATLPEVDLPMVGDVSKFTGEDVMLASVRASSRRTDAEGRFVLFGIAGDGSFSVGAWHPDHGGALTRGVRQGADDVEIRLRKTGSIRGVVTDASTGAPVADFDAATMVTMAMIMERAQRVTAVEKSADGGFTLDRLPGGQATLRIRAPGFAEYRQKVEVVAGEALDVGTLALQVGGTIRGTVRAPDGSPLAGITVGKKAAGMLDNPMLQAMFGSISATTDRQGRFELTDLPPGRVVLKASSQEYASAESKRIRLAAGEVVEDVVLTLGKGGEVVGRLALSDGISPRGWMVMLNSQRGGSMRSAELDDSGTFRFTGIDPGRYDVQAMQSEWMQGMQAEKMNMFRPGQSMDFGKLLGSMQDNLVRARCKVTEGEVTEVELDGSDIGESGVALSLRITLGDVPMASGFVEVERSDDGRILQGFVSKGRATIGTVQPGTYRVRVRSGVTLTPVGDPIALEVPKVETFQAPIRLAGGRIAGTVIDAETGEALSRAVVRIVSAAGAESDQAEEVGFAITALDGSFSFTGLNDGRYSVFANDSFFNQGDRRHSGRLDGLQISGGNEVTDVSLRARQAARARVRVASAGDVPVPMAMLLAVDAQGKPLSTLPSYTGKHGQASLGGLPEGSIRIVALSKHHAPGFSDPQEVQPGRATDFVVTMGSGPRVRVRVEDREGRVIRGARMSVRWQGGPWIPISLVQRFVPAFGGFEVGRLPRTTVEFRIHGAGGAPFVVRRQLDAGAAVDLTITVPK